MNSMRRELEQRYQDLFIKYQLEQPLDSGNVSSIIRQSLHDFLRNAKRPAIYCNGGHTKMLMDAYMYELKKVKYIVDNYAAAGQDNGFILIKDEEIEKHEIDAIILSTYKFRKNLKRSLKENHPGISVLDIYDKLEDAGILMEADYYYSNHPYQHYKRINQLQRDIKNENSEDVQNKLYGDLITKYIHIKDFRTAILKLKEWSSLQSIEQENRNRIEGLLSDVTALYELQKKVAASLPETHVLMLCLDGLRQQDLSEQSMPKLKKMVYETGYQFTNAYSFSTSTFESLIPTYSENDDLSTRYYEKNYVDIENCRFASLAEKQGRRIYIYGDTEPYIKGEHIHYSDQFLTVTEKLWQFILDAISTENGLFYIHELYESHFTFSNPYTELALMSEGTAMLFDFLPVKGGHLRTDYAKQHADAVRYLDDVLEPLLNPMKCRMVIYADHGNLILDYHTKLSEIGDMEYTCSESWIRIPLILRSPQTGVGTDDRLISLMQLNNMVISLLQKDTYQIPNVDYIKIARSELYNPDFRYLYHIAGKAQYLQAFEAFIMKEGNKLIIYADGQTELFLSDNDRKKSDKNLLTKIYEQVKEHITVCDVEKVVL